MKNATLRGKPYAGNVSKLVLGSLMALGVAMAHTSFAEGNVIPDIRYSDAAPSCTGDLHLPEGWTAETPVVLVIHGGGWSSMDKKDVVGIADFLVRDLRFAAFNINYRLASKLTPWPACGEDCIAAARYVLSGAFADTHGLRPKTIWVMGGSAGGHLALWTGLSLPTEKIAGIVSISGVADPRPDLAAHPGRYRSLFGGAEPIDARLDSMDILKLVRQNGPRILLTHATEDAVVPIASARNFACAYRAAGNELSFCEYPAATEHGLTGHCIWRPGSKPHRLIQTLERRISYFMLPARVPTPQPVKSSVEITALYYPGTEHMPEWDMVAQTRPEAKPLLGWYDESDPEAIDWQIKWAVEHGITSFCVDWYWNRGYRRLTHWLKGFYQAKHRKYLKWYMMYANHNQPGAHSTADQIAVTKFWIEHYFKTPEYYTIDGKPVVCYWQPRNLDRDFIAEAAEKGEKLAPGEGVKRALAISERLAKKAGLPGIHWQLIGRGTSHDSATAHAQRDMGFASAISYGFDHWRTYDMAEEAMPKIWQAKAVQSDLPWWVPLPTGWDDRPRSFSNARIVRDRTPEKFAAICREARQFCDRNGLRHVIIHPINEWQEGSYIEPNEEYGFGMYDAIRDAFCERPAAGWPKNLKPSDAGLGPYEFPASYHSPVQAWNFDSGSMEGWYRQPYGGGELEVKDGALNFWITRLNNYNVRQCVQPFAASKYSRFRIRMRITPNPDARPVANKNYCLRLKWGTPELPIIGPGLKVDNSRAMVSTPVKIDGVWHEYELPLASHPDWKGKVDEIWFEACALMHARVAVDWMRFDSDGDGISALCRHRGVFRPFRRCLPCVP